MARITRAGRRISREGPGGFEEYLYDGPHVIAILDDQQDVVSTLSYYPGVDRPHSLMTSSETYYYATDHTGSVSGLLDYSGTPDAVNTYRYDVWGRPQVATEAVPNPLRFKARLWDDYTGLADFRARWYDPDIGRFISEDPIGLAGGINVYRFVGNNPVSGWDPFGMNEDGPCEEGDRYYLIGWTMMTPDGVHGGLTNDPSKVPEGATPVYDECPGNQAPSPTGGYVDYATSGPAPVAPGTSWSPKGPGPAPSTFIRAGLASPLSATGARPTDVACELAKFHFHLQLTVDVLTVLSLSAIVARTAVVVGTQTLGRQVAGAAVGRYLTVAAHSAATVPDLRPDGSFYDLLIPFRAAGKRLEVQKRLCS